MSVNTYNNICLSNHQKKFAQICNNCNGLCHSHFSKMDRCPKCLGTGFLPKQKDTSKVWCGHSKKNLIKQHGFPAWYFCPRCAKTMKLGVNFV